jgi:2'-5' RNA ligase
MASEPGDYRIFVGAFPTGDLARRVQALRQRQDVVTARITAPHVTLAGTYWRSGPATPENEAKTIARLQAVRDQAQPFELVLGGVGSFLPHARVIYLEVEPTAALLAARRALLDALGPDKHRRFVPHLTLAMRLGRRETRSLLAQLQLSEWHSGRWPVPIDHLWLMQRGPEDPAWRHIQRIDLDGAGGEP